MVQTLAHNVLTQPAHAVYLNDPMDKPTDLEDKTEPLTPESNEPTSASNGSNDDTFKKRHDDLKRHYDSVVPALRSEVGELKSQISELTTKLSEKEVSSFKPPLTKEETKAFVDKYPEVANNIISIASDVVSRSNSVINEKIKQLEEKTNSLSSQNGVLELKKLHPDFEEIKDDPRFHDWFGRQPKEVKALIQSPNPTVIALGLDKYKEYAGIKTTVQRAEAKKDATREPKVPTSRVQIGEPGKRTYTNAEINKMPMSEFEKYQDDIKAAQYDGRIVG